MPSLGANTMVPVTRYQEVRLPPVGCWTVTRTSDPTCAPSWRRVVAPSATSDVVRGSRPTDATSGNGPRSAAPASALTTRPSIMTPPPPPMAMSVMSGSCSRVVTSAENWAALAWLEPLGENHASYHCP